MIKTSEQLRAMSVVGAGGRVFGTVDELEVETEGMRISSMIVRITSDAVSDLGIKKPFWSSAKLVVNIGDVQAVTDVVVLRLTIEEFSQRLGNATTDS